MKHLKGVASIILTLGISTSALASFGEDQICWAYNRTKLFVLLGPELDVRPALTEGSYHERSETEQGPVWSSVKIHCLTDGETCAEPGLLTGAKDSGIVIRLRGFLASVSSVSAGQESPVQTLTCRWGDADEVF